VRICARRPHDERPTFDDIEGLQSCKRGLAYVWLHYVYEPLFFRRRAEEARACAEQSPRKLASRTRSTLELEEAVDIADEEPFVARLPSNPRLFVEPCDQHVRPDVCEVQRTMPQRRESLRDSLEEWRASLLGLNERVGLLRRLRTQTWSRHFFSRVPLHVRRGSEFDSAAGALLAATTPELLSGVHVCFYSADRVAELGVDSGGLTREFFDLAIRGLVAPSDRTPSKNVVRQDSGLSNRDSSDGEPMFREQADRALMLIPSSRPRAMYMALGRLVAAALVHASRGDVALPMMLNDCLLKYMVGQPVTAADVRRRDPIYFKNRIESLLHPGGIEEMAEILGVDRLTFEEEGNELVPNGKQIGVTPDNVERYVGCLSEAYICGGVRSELSHFLSGFHCIVPKEILNRCSITFADLGMLLSGVPQLDVNEWQQHSVFVAAGVSKHVAQLHSEWFWSLLTEWPQSEKAAVLAFVTGCSRLPAVGFSGLDPHFTVEVVQSQGDALPTAHTCKNSLSIPAYPSQAVLKSKLELAVHEGTGSGFDFR